VPFVTSHRPVQPLSEPAHWFAFSGDRILVETKGDTVNIPLLRDLSSLGLKPVCTLHIGTLDRTVCLACDLGAEPNLPEGTALSGLRRIFGAVDDELFWAAGRAFQLIEFERNHRRCGRCGGSTMDKGEERAKLCPDCGLAVFPRMSPAIIVAVRDGGRILLAHSGRFPEGMHSVLAGFVESGESLEQCVQREVREEVGVEVKNIRYFGSQPWPFPNSLMIGFTADYAGGEIQVDAKEILSAGWFPADALPPRIPDKISIARKLIDAFVETVTSNQ
jgi:NAD+ diphosphatase